MCWLALNRGGVCVSVFLSGRRENSLLVVGITFFSSLGQTTGVRGLDEVTLLPPLTVGFFAPRGT